MAVLHDEHLEFEVFYPPMPDDDLGSFGIDLGFRWQGKPLLNPAVVRCNVGENRIVGVIGIQDWTGCPILSMHPRTGARARRRASPVRPASPATAS